MPGGSVPGLGGVLWDGWEEGLGDAAGLCVVVCLLESLEFCEVCMRGIAI